MGNTKKTHGRDVAATHERRALKHGRTQLPTSLRKRQGVVVATEIVRAMRGRKARSNPAYRISLARHLVRLLPCSQRQVAEVIRDSDGLFTEEIRFSIFCAFDEMVTVKNKAQVFRVLGDATKSFLSKVRTDRAGSAWMAADAIGEYWPTQSAYRLLSDVLNRRQASVVGRTAAVRGLHMLANRAGKRIAESAIRTIRCTIVDSTERKLVATATVALDLIERHKL